MAKKQYTVAQKAATRKVTRLESFILSLVTGVICLVITSLYLFKITNPAGNESLLFKYLMAIVKNVLFVYIVYPIGWTLGAISIISSSMCLSGRNIGKKMIKDAKKYEQQAQNDPKAVIPKESSVEEATAMARDYKEKRTGRWLTIASAIVLAVVVVMLLTCAIFSLKSYLPF